MKLSNVFYVTSLSLILITGSITPFAFAAAPEKPENLRFNGQPTATSLVLQWDAPLSDGGAAITGYKIDRATESTPGTFGSYSTVVSNTTFNSGQGYTFSGLTAGNFFKFKIYAINADGTSTASSEFSGGTTPPENQEKNYSSSGNQTFSAGQTFGTNTAFADSQKFGGVMNFGSSQTFGAGTEFQDDQTFSGTHDFSAGSSKFGAGTSFNTQQSFGAGANFTGAQTFTGSNTFGDSAKFGDGQEFSTTQTFGTGTNFTGQTTFAANQEFPASSVFAGCDGVGDCQSFGDDDLDFTGSSMKFGNGTHFGKARTFGGSMNFTGAQQFVGSNTFGDSAKFGDGQEFSATQTFGTGTNFTGQTTFAANQEFPASSVFAGCDGVGDCQSFGDDDLDFTGSSMKFGNGTHFGKARTFGGSMNFTGMQQFIGQNIFGDGAQFGDGQTFSGKQTFGENTIFTDAIAFTSGQSMEEGMKFAGCGEAGDCQSFGLDDFSFTNSSMKFGNGTHFGKARAFGDSMNFTGMQQFIGQNVFGTGAVFGDGQTFSGKQTFGTGTNFTDAIAFTSGQSMEEGMAFAGCGEAGDCQSFGLDTYSFTNGSMSFGNGTHFGKARTFGDSMNFTGMQQFIGTNTFGAYTEFGDSQEFSAAQTWDAHTHFGTKTDFTGASNFAFKDGMTFGEGTTFANGQSVPTNVVMDYGIVLSAVTCGTDTNSAADCKPTDDSKYLAPGEFLTSGQDPVAISQKLTSSDKSLDIDGLGFAMTFDTISNDGTVSVDAMDPSTVTNVESVASDGKIQMNTNEGQAKTVGSIINISTRTANATGSMTVTLDYQEANIPDGVAESDLVMVHQVGGAWQEETDCNVDTANNKISCTLTSLSPVGVGSKASSSGASTGSSAGYPGLWYKALHENNFDLFLDNSKINDTTADLEIAGPDNPQITGTVGTPLSLKLMLPDAGTYSIKLFEVCLLVPESRFSYCSEYFDPNITWAKDTVTFVDLNDNNYFLGPQMITYDDEDRSFTTAMNFARSVQDTTLKISLSDGSDMHRQYYNLIIYDDETVSEPTPESIEQPTLEPTPEPTLEPTVPKTEIFESNVVDIEIDAPESASAGEIVPIDVTFHNEMGGLYSSVNYDILVTHNGETLIDETGVYEQNGVGKHTTPALNTDASDENPINVIITFQGFGVDEPLTGPIGITSDTKVVPEFGTIAALILVIAIASIIAVSAKSRLSFMPRL